MVRWVRGFAAASLVVLAVMFSTPSMAIAQTAEGQAVYESNCVACHAADLSGGVGKALNAGSAAADLPDGQLVDIITNGVSGTAMPAWGDQLSAEEITAVVSYIRSVQAGEATAEQPAAAAPSEPSARFPWGLVFIITAAVILSAGIIVIVVNPGFESFTWKSAYLRGFVLFFYFFLLTVWIPSTMFTEAPISSAPRIIQDLVVSGAWFTMFAVGVVALRFLQKAKKI